MEKNIGTADRTIRIIAGATIVSLTFWGPKTPWAALGIIPILTGVFGKCGLYTLLGINTCRRAT